MFTQPWLPFIQFQIIIKKQTNLGASASISNAQTSYKTCFKSITKAKFYGKIDVKKKVAQFSEKYSSLFLFTDCII